jgi:hypothetical protein
MRKSERCNGRGRASVLRLAQARLQAGTLAEAVGVALQGCAQTVALEVRRVQKVGECAHLLGGFLQGAGDFAKEL